MEFTTFAPAIGLTTVVERYWHAMAPEGTGTCSQTWLPSVMHCMVLNFNNRMGSITTRQGEKKLPFCFVLGNLTSPGHNIAISPFDVFAVQFKPMGIHQLFNIPLHQLLDTPIDLEQIEKQPVAAELIEALQTSHLPHEYIAILEKYFSRKLLEHAPDRKVKLFEPVVQRVLSSKGCIQIKNLTQLTYYTKKTLERHCMELIGPTPKQFISIIRFHAAIAYMQQNDWHSVKDFIYDLGYFDHAHFLHDFKKLSGLTPPEVFLHLTDPSKFFYGL
jgi:AraC-like DNA-binding protein